MAMGIECFRVLFPKNMDANEYALKVQPAPKGLGVMLNKAEWLGKGKRPMTAVIEPTPAAPRVAATSGTQYYHADHLGTARLMTDASGNVVAGSESTTLPYGEEYTPTTAGNHYKFTGKERDAESGLDYFGARYYGSNMGRFMTPDRPFADQKPRDPQSWNLYSYVTNNPLRYVDPTGTVKRDCHGADYLPATGQAG